MSYRICVPSALPAQHSIAANGGLTDRIGVRLAILQLHLHQNKQALMIENRKPDPSWCSRLKSNDPCTQSDHIPERFVGNILGFLTACPRYRDAKHHRKTAYTCPRLGKVAAAR